MLTASERRWSPTKRPRQSVTDSLAQAPFTGGSPPLAAPDAWNAHKTSAAATSALTAARGTRSVNWPARSGASTIAPSSGHSHRGGGVRGEGPGVREGRPLTPGPSPLTPALLTFAIAPAVASG